MSDDRFSDPNTFKRPEKNSGDWYPLDVALRDAIAAGNEAEVSKLIAFLPEAKRERYRQIWIEAKRQREEGSRS